MTSQFISIRRDGVHVADPAIGVDSILAAIRAEQPSELKAMLYQLEDRVQFFTEHEDAISTVVQECQSDEVLLVLLKLG